MPAVRPAQSPAAPPSDPRCAWVDERAAGPTTESATDSLSVPALLAERTHLLSQLNEWDDKCCKLEVCARWGEGVRDGWGE